MNADVTAAAPAAAPKIEPWPAARLREGLLSSDHGKRVEALAMSVQPQMVIDECVAAIVGCVEASRADPMACQLAAVALANTKQESEKAVAANCLATLVTAANSPAVRIFAAHGMAQLALVPHAAWPSLAEMLFADDSNMRQVVLRAVTPFAVAGASFLAQATAAATPPKWTTEGLAALAYSAGVSDESKQRVEQFVLRSLDGQGLMPTGIAGYAALARLNPNGVAPLALAKIAVIDDDKTAITAINALAQLGEVGNSAVPGLVVALAQTENPEREEAIIRALLPMKIQADDVPLPRVLSRIETGPDRAVAAHCLLLCMHAKAFTAASKIVAARYAVSAEALKRVLDEVHHQLVGARLSLPQTAPATSQSN